MKKRIIVPTDFTKASGQAIKQAVVIASQAGSSLTLLHILEEKPAEKEIIREKLTLEAERIRQNTGVACDVLLQEGDLINSIPQTVCEKDYDLMVIGTHGVHGVRQMLFGADILKLVAKIPIPVLVVQEDSRLIDKFQKVVLPVGSHDTFNLAVDAVLLFAEMFDLEVHLYSIQKPGFDWPIQMLTNIEETTRRFREKGVRMVRIKEEQEGFSQGYARQTLKYAHSIGADTIWMISLASQEYYYMAKAYKEAMLLNEFHLPVLCAGGGCN
jgi:nucleotide-binding universal stress UspA family protein